MNVHVGGIAEMYVGDPNQEVIVLLHRRGFVAVAVEKGVPIAPCFHFGNSKLLEFGPRRVSHYRITMEHSITFQTLSNRVA